MIRFTGVFGNVLIEDKKNHYSQMARNGMDLDETGDYLIVTTENSAAVINAFGDYINLPPSHFLRLDKNRKWKDSHYYRGRDFKLIIGKIWFKIAGDPRNWDPGGSGGGGIRG